MPSTNFHFFYIIKIYSRSIRPVPFTLAGGNARETHKVILSKPLAVAVFATTDPSIDHTFMVPPGEYTLLSIKNPHGLPGDILIIKKLFDKDSLIGMSLKAWQDRTMGWGVTLIELPTVVELLQPDKTLLDDEAVASSA